MTGVGRDKCRGLGWGRCVTNRATKPNLSQVCDGGVPSNASGKVGGEKGTTKKDFPSRDLSKRGGAKKWGGRRKEVHATGWSFPEIDLSESKWLRKRNEGL